MTRDEHLEWSKKRAMEYFHRGDMVNAVSSMLSDLGKHPELEGIGKQMAIYGIFLLTNKNPNEIRRFIEGFR